MELRITGRHAHIGEKVKQYAHEKLEPLSRYYQGTRYLEVVFDENHLGNELEIIAHLTQGKPVIAKIRHKDAFAAIDLAHDKLERLLTREKEKKRERRRDGAVVPVKAETPKTGEEE